MDVEISSRSLEALNVKKGWKRAFGVFVSGNTFAIFFFKIGVTVSFKRCWLEVGCPWHADHWDGLRAKRLLVVLLSSGQNTAHRAQSLNCIAVGQPRGTEIFVVLAQCLTVASVLASKGLSCCLRLRERFRLDLYCIPLRQQKIRISWGVGMCWDQRWFFSIK